MKPELRKKVIEAIHNKDLHTLRAIKEIANDNGHVPVYFQVYGKEQIYNQNGSKAEPQETPEPIPQIEGIPPRIGSIVVTYATFEAMQEAFKKVVLEGRGNFPL